MQKKAIPRNDLTRGGILKKLLVIAVPIMGTNLMQMGYNLTDMFWLGRVGPNAVAASGTAGMFMWLSMAFLLFGRMGAEIGVAQNLGAGNPENAKKYAANSFKISLILGLFFGAVMVLFRTRLIGFFNIQEPEVAKSAENYLWIVSLAMPFNFMTAALGGAFNGSGNSRTPFIANAIGLAANMILDPIFIFPLNMGVIGAAVATAISQAVVCFVMVIAMKKDKARPFKEFRFFAKFDRDVIKRAAGWTTPIMLESLLFTLMSMIVTRFINGFGSDAMAVSRVGSQVESMSWLIGGGFGSALTAFVGQNYGAGKWGRIGKGFRLSAWVMVGYGIIISLVMRIFAGSFYDLFLPNEPAIREMGIVYLTIIALCQVPQCLEAVAGGTLKGIGKTLPPSIISISTNVLRVIVVILLSKTDLGLNGIWIAITVTCAMRGFGMVLYYLLTANKRPKEDNLPLHA
jgi:putative efflux protein, MATE family